MGLHCCPPLWFESFYEAGNSLKSNVSSCLPNPCVTIATVTPILLLVWEVNGELEVLLCLAFGLNPFFTMAVLIWSPQGIAQSTSAKVLHKEFRVHLGLLLDGEDVVDEEDEVCEDENPKETPKENPEPHLEVNTVQQMMDFFSSLFGKRP